MDDDVITKLTTKVATSSLRSPVPFRTTGKQHQLLAKIRGLGRTQAPKSSHSYRSMGLSTRGMALPMGHPACERIDYGFVEEPHGEIGDEICVCVADDCYDGLYGVSVLHTPEWWREVRKK